MPQVPFGAFNVFQDSAALGAAISFLMAFGQLREILEPHADVKSIEHILAPRPESELGLTHGVPAVR